MNEGLGCNCEPPSSHRDIAIENRRPTLTRGVPDRLVAQPANDVRQRREHPVRGVESGPRANVLLEATRHDQDFGGCVWRRRPRGLAAYDTPSLARFRLRGARRLVRAERGRLLDRPGLSVVCAGKMNLPTADRAERERRSLAVARGDVAGPVRRAERDGFLAGAATSPLSLAGHRLPSLWKRLADPCSRTAKRRPTSKPSRERSALSVPTAELLPFGVPNL